MFNNQSNNAGKTIVSKLTSDRSGKMSTYVAILLVSVGKDNFEDNAIRSAIKMIDNEFQCCYIVVADTLQRYNIEVEKEISSVIFSSINSNNKLENFFIIFWFLLYFIAQIAFLDSLFLY